MRPLNGGNAIETDPLVTMAQPTNCLGHQWDHPGDMRHLASSALCISATAKARRTTRSCSTHPSAAFALPDDHFLGDFVLQGWTTNPGCKNNSTHKRYFEYFQIVKDGVPAGSTAEPTAREERATNHILLQRAGISPEAIPKGERF